MNTITDAYQLDDGSVVAKSGRTWRVLLLANDQMQLGITRFDISELLGQTFDEAREYVWEFYVECPAAIQA